MVNSVKDGQQDGPLGERLDPHQAARRLWIRHLDLWNLNRIQRDFGQFVLCHMMQTSPEIKKKAFLTAPNVS